jgi:hypothetical protein
MEFNETTDVVKLDKSAAIEKAKEIVGASLSLEAKKITGALVKYTNKEVSKLPNSNITLQNYPVWIITFEGVHMKKNGPKSIKLGTSDVLADTNVIIDANSGEMIEIISYSSLNK